MAELKVDKDKARVAIHGDLNKDSVMAAHAAFQQLCKDPTDWNIDFSQIGAVDSSALALIIEWKKMARAKGCELHLSALPEDLQAIARLSQMESLLID